MGLHSRKGYSNSHNASVSDLSNENSGPIIFLGGLLLLITSILEFVLGNTFPCVVFGTIGKFTSIVTDTFMRLLTRNRWILVCLCGLNDPCLQFSRFVHTPSPPRQEILLTHSKLPIPRQAPIRVLDF